MSFDGKVVLVTGASSGIGAATAILFASKGARVALVGRNEAKLSNVAEKCSANCTPLVICADIANERETAAIIQKTIDHFGKLDVLVNSAGMDKLAPVDDPNILETFDKVMSTNLRSVVQLTGLAAPYLKATKGNVVNVSSIGAKMVLGINCMPHCVSKAGMDHYTRCAALDLAPSGVRVNSVNPGPVVSDILENSGVAEPGAGTEAWDRYKNLTALGRVGEPEEIGDLIVFLASDQARSITGSTFVSDNGSLLKWY